MAIAEAEIAEAEDIILYPGMPITEEELMRLPDDGFLYELVDGRLDGQPCKSFFVGIITANIVGLLGLFARGNGIMTLGKAGFRMANRNIRVPSVSYTRKERFLGGHAPDAFGDLAPDLCVEIISPSDRPGQMSRKVQEYFDGGASAGVARLPGAAASDRVYVADQNADAGRRRRSRCRWPAARLLLPRRRPVYFRIEITMQYRNFGTTDLRASVVGFGVWTVSTRMWGVTDASVRLRLLRRAYELGVTFYDTADVYGDGLGETILG